MRWLRENPQPGPGGAPMDEGPPLPVSSAHNGDPKKARCSRRDCRRGWPRGRAQDGPPLKRDSATRTAYLRSPPSIRSSRARGAVNDPAYDTEQREEAGGVVGEGAPRNGSRREASRARFAVGRTRPTRDGRNTRRGSTGGRLGRDEEYWSASSSQTTRAQPSTAASGAVAISPAGHGPGPPP